MKPISSRKDIEIKWTILILGLVDNNISNYHTTPHLMETFMCSVCYLHVNVWFLINIPWLLIHGLTFRTLLLARFWDVYFMLLIDWRNVRVHKLLIWWLQLRNFTQTHFTLNQYVSFHFVVLLFPCCGCVLSCRQGLGLPVQYL